METDIIPLTDSSCEELYSDIKTDSFDVLTSQCLKTDSFDVLTTQCFDLNPNLPRNHHTLSSEHACHFDNTIGAVRFHSLDSEVIEHLDSVCLNVDNGRQEDSSLSVINAANDNQADLSLSGVYADSGKPDGLDLLAVYAGSDKQDCSNLLAVCDDGDKQDCSNLLAVYDDGDKQDCSNLLALYADSDKQDCSNLLAVYSDNNRQEGSGLAVYADSDKQDHTNLLDVYANRDKQENSDFAFHGGNGKQEDSGLTAIYADIGYPKSSTLQIAVDSGVGQTKQQDNINRSNQSLVRFTNIDTDYLKTFVRTKQDEITDLSINNFDGQSKDFDINCNNDITCHKNDNDNKVTLSSWVKFVKTENEALQMFLVDDPDTEFNEENSCNNSLKLKTNTDSHNNASEELPKCNQEEMKNTEKPTVDIALQKKHEETESVQNKHTNDNLCEEATCYNTQSCRSLRLNVGKRSTPSFSYKIYSDDENLIDIENEILTINALINETSRNSKSKSVSSDSAAKVKPYACDVCSVTCKTAFNLQQHKLTHNTNKSIICKQCNYSCKKKSDMRKHEETHGPQNLHKCMECDYSGKRLRYLKKHMRIHSRDILFSCHLCEYRSENKTALDNHVFGHSNLKPYSCEDCGDSFKQKSSLNKHMLSHSNGCRISYSLCMKTFIDKDFLERHKAGHKQDIQMNKNVNVDEGNINVDEDCNRVSEDDVSNADDVEIKSTTPNINIEDFSKNVNKTHQKILGTYGFLKMKGGPVQCTMCSYSCTSKNVLRRHMRRHSDNKPYVCPQCGASFKRKDHLKVHRLTHSNIRPYKCPHCLYGTHRKYRLTLHILTHQTLKPVKCSLCVYSCRRDCELRYHMRNKHGRELELTSEQPQASCSDVGDVILKCELCNYTCDSQKRLKYHMTRHENKTPHCCPHCDYKCSSRSSLTDHLLQHAGIKPCLCSVCGMAFRNTSRLNRHRLVHSDVKPYGCSFCDFSSRSKYNLKQHVLRHTDQERARRRIKKPLKPKSNNFNNNEVIKQFIQPDLLSLVDHTNSELILDNVQPQRGVSQMTHELKNNSKLMESFQSVPIPQYFNINQMDITNDHYKHRDRNVDPSSCSFNTVHYPNTSMNPYHIDRVSCPSALTPTPAYSDPYQNPNPFVVHPHPMTYSTNSVHPNFCYADCNSYGFANSYFYNDSVFPRNINANMNVYMCSSSSSPYTLNSNSTLPINQNFVNLNPQINQTVHHAQPPTSAPLIPVINNQTQPISESEHFHIHSLMMSEDISMDVPDNQVNEIPKPSQPKSQAKKTGATLNSSTVVTKYSDCENVAKLTHICSDCGYICLTNTMLQRHKTTHVDFKPHKCEDCGKSFKRMDHMKAHKRTHNQNKPYNCKHCTYTCSRKYRLKLHEMTHVNEQPYSCNFCESVFDAHLDLKEHSRVHYESFTFACSRCDFKCEEKTELRYHHETHNTFLCEECSYVCRSNREFSSHKRMHAEKEELTCSLCNYKCDSQKRLKYHMERHKNKTPHQCPHCDYKCSSRSSLTDHLLQHEGLKPFLCSACGMRFRNISRLNRHKMTHTDIKPHNCDYCPFSSRSRYNLKQHMLRHFK